MAGTASEPTTLSRASDHLGNLANILKDLGGGGTLLHELTQNANDAEADRITFVASHQELTVWNSAVFTDCGHQEKSKRCPWKVDEGRRSCDLHSFREVAGRHKADDARTTGAFGVGFTAVYQVTDHPEVLTAGRHLILDESRDENKRIVLCPGGCPRDHASAGTTFYLPWARQHTPLRRDLSAPPLTDADVARLVDELHDAAGAALVFLDRTQVLSIESPERTSKVGRRQQGNRITITVNGDSSEWLLLEGEAEGADRLKEEYEPDSSRSSLVQVAVPVEESVVGRIFADLPTETRTGWSGHVNATFFPRQDRKGVEFDSRGFRGKWNDILIDAAAVLVADNLETIAQELGHRVAWNYLVDVERVNRDIAKDEYPAVFSEFFERAKELASASRIALLADDTGVLPAGTLVPRDEEEYDAVEVLLRLGVPVLAPSIRPLARQTTLTQYGMSLLGISDVVSALEKSGIAEAWEPERDDALLTADDVDALLRLVNHLQERGKSLLANSSIAGVAIVPCVDGTFAAASRVSKLEEDDRALFELLDPDLKIVDTERLAGLCPNLIDLCDDINPERAVAIFEADPAALEVAPDLVLDWLDNHRAALAQELRARVSALPLFPSTGGELRPLTELSLSSDFDDLLGVADVVDRDKTAGHTDLLRLLGARELDAVEYLLRHVAPAAVNGLSTDQARQVLEIIQRHRVELDQTPGAREILRQTPLVPCSDGLHPAHNVHLPNPALTLIAPEAPIADTRGMASHLLETLVWLGVSAHPSNEVLNEAAFRLGEQDVTPDADVVLAILDALPNPPESETVSGSLRSLQSAAWLPCEGGGRDKPDQVFATFQRYLFESQGKKLALHVTDQGRLAPVLEWLGVQRTPATAMVIAHLRHCVSGNSRLHPEVYRALGQAKEEHAVRALSREPCVQIGDGVFVEPNTVFWSDPGLGEWAHVLAPGHRDYQAFFDRVGVSESAQPAHVEETLRRISRAAGNTRLDEDAKRVVHRCWELLDQHLHESADTLPRLGAIRSAVGPRDVLEKPELLLFADGRRLAETILLIRDNLIRRDRSTHRALAAAGVRPAEEVITPCINEGAPSTEASSLAALVDDRRPALERLAEAQRVEDGAQYDLNRLAETGIEVMPDLTVEYVTRFAHQHQVDPPRPTEAIYLPDENRLIVRTETPNRHIAREIALCIAPGIDVSSLAPSILEVLTASDLTGAMTVLDEYGVRDLDHTEWERVGSQTSVEVEDLDLDPLTPSDPDLASNQLDDPPVSSDDDSTDYAALDAASEPGGNADGDGTPSSTNSSRKRPQRRSGSGQRRTHMASFVSFDDEDQGHDDGGDEAPEKSPVDIAGVRRVLEYERSCGRTPEEQAHNNPGYDILSKDSDGAVLRRIEIKSIGGAWTGFGVWMSATQLEENRTHPDDFWLYVVEHAEDDDAAVIHRIQNPVGEATKFGFDAGWQALREPEIERDESGKALIASTRRLLVWDGSTSASQPPAD
ncbi:protein of unknown function [Pedococcus dokdonensis]|uniref:Uncharacterized protein n=1 Tax=Pedococcus dokdonensis TaxID=443156 RepID=A0A1H0U4J7_9MICO|nr:DUF3883 domain-containing protein [Pedococcus dokdonensis]SDP61094.1 protein of unknown function [Pedococcus dokdonensis]